MTDHALVLTDGDASRLWNWVLGKQGLSPEKRLPDAHTAADKSLGLHAARLPSPFTTAIARTRHDADLSSLLGPASNPQLITVRCVRKTLHVLPTQIAAVALASTRDYRLRDVQNLIRKAHLDHCRLKDVQQWLLAELASETRSHRELEISATQTGWTRTEARLALKWCWEAGLITYRNASHSWHREVRRFSLTRNSYPDLAVELDTETSKDELIRLYFHRYGPATLRDASWWSGIGQQRILAALNNVDVVHLRLPWAKNLFYMPTRDYQSFLAVRPGLQYTGVNFLAHEDVALKAYHESRTRYLGELPPRAVFNQIGEVLPTIMWNGRIIGRWRWDHARSEVIHRHFPQASVPDDIRAASRILSRALRDRLRQGYVTHC